MPKKLISAVLLFCFTSSMLLAQTPEAPAGKPAVQTAQPSSPASAEPKAAQGPKGFVLQDSTPVRLRTGRTISSADAHVGDTLDFEVLEDVMVDGVVIIPKGGAAFGTVTEAEPKRRMARGGKLNVNIDFARMVNEAKAPLRAVKEVKGGGHTGAMTAGIVATGIVFFPAAPFFLFMHGKDITIPKGTEITAYVNGDLHLDRAKFQPAATPAPVAGAPSPATPPVQEQASGAQLQISSTPAGADIEIDGNFVGSTPSTISASAGEHHIVIKKAGFIAWEKKMTVSTGQVTIHADLSEVGKQ